MAHPPRILPILQWSEHLVTYGATFVAVASAAIYLVLEHASEVALSAYGLDAAGFAVPISEMVMSGTVPLVSLTIAIALFWWPIGVPSRCLASKLPTPPLVSKLEAWVKSNQRSSLQRAAILASAICVPLCIFALFWAGAAIGRWRVSNAEWIVSANQCASDCFTYTVEGRSGKILGKTIASNGTRLAIVVGPGKAEKVELEKVLTVEAYKGKPLAGLNLAPWYIRAGWHLLDILNARW